MFPTTTSTSAAIAAANAGIAVATVDIRVSVEIIVVVDGDVVVATPTAVPPAAAPRGSHSHSNSERNRHARCVVAGRRVVNGWIWVNRRTVHDRRVITWNVDYFGVGLFDDYNGLALDNLCFYFHLLIRLQVSRVLRFGAHALHRVHDIGLLRQKGVAQICRPLDVVSRRFTRSGSPAMAWILESQGCLAAA